MCAYLSDRPNVTNLVCMCISDPLADDSMASNGIERNFVDQSLTKVTLLLCSCFYYRNRTVSATN